MFPLHHPDGFFIVVVELPQGSFLDMGVDTDDDRQYSQTTLEPLARPDHAENIVIQYFAPGTAVTRLVEALQTEAPVGWTRRSPDELDAFFVACWERNTHFRLRRGFTFEEVRRFAEPSHVDPEDSSTINQARELLNDMLYEQADHYFVMRWLRQCDLSAAEWMDLNESVSVIHSHSDKDTVAWMFEDRLDESVLESASRLASPLLVFERLNAQLAENRQLEVLHRFDTPIDALVVLDRMRLGQTEPHWKG